MKPLALPVLLTLLLALPLAGCLEDSPPQAPTASKDDGEPVTPSGTEPMPGSLKEQLAATPEDAPVYFVMDGRTGQFVCAASACHTVSPSTGGYYDPTAPVAKAVNATVTWTAATPATQQMVVGIYRALTDCTDNCTDADFELVTELRGPSPLAIAADGLDDRVAVFVSYGYFQQGVPAYGRPVDQAYRIDGVLTPA